MTEVSEVNNQQQANPEVIQPADTKQQETTQEESAEQINWKKFRQKRAEERKLLEEAQTKSVKQAEEISSLKMAIEAIVNKPNANQSVDETESKDEDAVKRYVEEAIKAHENKSRQQREEQERQELPSKLGQTFNDFNQICSHENLDYLEYHYPEVAAGFKHMPESFEKWANIYKAIKRFIPNPDHSKDAKKAEKNALKPQSMNSAGMTASGDSAPVILDDKRRADNWSRMQRVIRGLK